MQTTNAENANTEARMHLVPDTYIIIHFVNVFRLCPNVGCHDRQTNRHSDANERSVIKHQPETCTVSTYFTRATDALTTAKNMEITAK